MYDLTEQVAIAYITSIPLTRKLKKEVGKIPKGSIVKVIINDIDDNCTWVQVKWGTWVELLKFKEELESNHKEIEKLFEKDQIVSDLDIIRSEGAPDELGFPLEPGRGLVANNKKSFLPRSVVVPNEGSQDQDAVILAKYTQPLESNQVLKSLSAGLEQLMRQVCEILPRIKEDLALVKSSEAKLKLLQLVDVLVSLEKSTVDSLYSVLGTAEQQDQM